MRDQLIPSGSGDWRGSKSVRSHLCFSFHCLYFPAFFPCQPTSNSDFPKLSAGSAWHVLSQSSDPRMSHFSTCNSWRLGFLVATFLLQIDYAFSYGHITLRNVLEPKQSKCYQPSACQVFSPLHEPQLQCTCKARRNVQSPGLRPATQGRLGSPAQSCRLTLSFRHQEQTGRALSLDCLVFPSLQNSDIQISITPQFRAGKWRAL